MWLIKSDSNYLILAWKSISLSRCAGKFCLFFLNFPRRWIECNFAFCESNKRFREIPFCVRAHSRQLTKAPFRRLDNCYYVIRIGEDEQKRISQISFRNGNKPRNIREKIFFFFVFSCLTTTATEVSKTEKRSSQHLGETNRECALLAQKRFVLMTLYQLQLSLFYPPAFSRWTRLHV